MKQINVQQVEEKLKNNEDVTLIDVRETDEVAAGKIPGVINIPLGLIEFRMQELDKSKEYVMVCRSGSRSGLATQFLQSHGFNVTNMGGGMISWQGDVETSRQNNYTMSR
ncbi:rhodanese-like domain-containing protein [Salipaludibacillus daqingensis]|uniref:rhodanese-like domain-containing protein n=1 Tax=Salipaludibacillus daqingensis TaxID=3041001 RepID=UPI0024734E8A|nr:rhodanese-like domain-containing protein [Salipaludibacillus daqingensis]